MFLHHNLFNLPPTVGHSGDFQIVLMVENPGSYTCVNEASISTLRHDQGMCGGVGDTDSGKGAWLGFQRFSCVYFDQ